MMTGKLTLCGLVLLAGLMCGCDTTGRSGIEQPLHLQVVSGGMVKFGRRLVELPNLAGALTAAGVSRQRHLIVTVPRSEPVALMDAVTRELAKGGYVNMAFIRPRTTRVDTE